MRNRWNAEPRPVSLFAYLAGVAIGIAVIVLAADGLRLQGAMHFLFVVVGAVIAAAAARLVWGRIYTY
jgi:hypothetical protein